MARGRDLPFPPASGARLEWRDLPPAVRSALERWLGAEVAEARSQPGGFSPGLAARMRLTDGRRVFVKAAGSETNPDTPELHRREARIAALLPPDVPTPRFLSSYDDGDWVALAFEDVGGRPPRVPWRRRELERVLDAAAALASALTPSPVPLETVAQVHAETFSGFRELLKPRGADPASLDDLDPWVARNLDRLAALEASWPEASRGDTLLHLDLRADNLLVTSDDVLVVDWPHAAVGAAWIDLLAMLPSVAMQGGPDPWTVFDANHLARTADPEAMTTMVCALAGLFVARGRLPHPPGLPTLRAFQRAQGAESVRWLRRRTGWP
jgi:aminoglycoside phosphotransferase (APT) family kinase protein